MWSDDYKESKLSLDIELSTFCNARCPQCSRTDEFNNLNKKEWLPLKSVTIAKFKKWFPQKDLNHIKNFHFSGTYGDPGMCKDLYKIVSYIIDNSDTTTVSINTNGSMRDEAFWWDIGAKGQTRLKVIFDVDGINQEMHEFYRRGTTLSKILNNMSAILETPAEISVLTILFKHNQDYLDDIQNMCRKLGVKNFDWVEGNNFIQSIYKFNDETGNALQLEQVSRNRPAINAVNVDGSIISPLVKDDSERKSRRVRDYRHLDSIENYTKIECHAAYRKNIKISVNGLVSPCCHLSPSLENFCNYKHSKLPRSSITPAGVLADPILLEPLIAPIMQEYINNPNIYNLNHNNIFNIVNSTWYNKSLPESWNDLETACYGCKRVCGKV